MPLQPGERLGPYEVLAPIGKGGMGEVYGARDTKLDRDVAIKALPAKGEPNETHLDPQPSPLPLTRPPHPSPVAQNPLARPSPHQRRQAQPHRPRTPHPGRPSRAERNLGSKPRVPQSLRPRHRPLHAARIEMRFIW